MTDEHLASDQDLTAAIEYLAHAHELLVAMDFDGTLSPIVERPEDARPLPASHAALIGLGRLPHTRVALVSGRALDSLRTVASPQPDWLLVGSHGVEIDLGTGEAAMTFTPEEIAALAEWRERLIPIVNAFPGALVELKPAGLAFHSRNVTDVGGADAAVSAAFKTQLAVQDPAVHWYERRGKAVREFALRDATKAEGLNLLRSTVKPDATLFAGDDVTDEDALSQLGTADVGIHLGDTPSVASLSVASPQTLASILEALLERRRAANR